MLLNMIGNNQDKKLQPNVLRMIVLRSLYKHNDSVQKIQGDMQIHVFLESMDKVMMDLEKQLKTELQEVLDGISPNATVTQFIQQIYSYI